MDTKDLIETILDQAVPGDLTLGELKKYTQALEMWKQIPGVDAEGFVVRFVRDDVELPDNMTIGEFRSMKDASMHLSIRRGGVMEDA